jgi:phosphate transport system substrate-binding protein
MILGVSQLRADAIRIKGFDTLGAKLVPMLCEEYKKQHPEVSFEIAAEGTASSLPDFFAGEADILMAARALRTEEMEAFEKAGIVLKHADAATDAFVIAVNAEKPVRELLLAQLEGLFAGDLAKWKAVGGHNAPVSLHIRNTASGSYKEFQQAAMKGRPYANGAIKLPGGESSAMVVQKERHGITFLGPAYARAKGLAVVSIDGVDPMGKDAGRYPWLRHYYYYHRSDARAKVVEFVRWASSSPEARKIGGGW